jgi:hypothetical protein
MRPSFRVAADCSAAALRDTIERHLISDAEDVEGDLSARNGFLRIPEARRRFWTPCLELTIEDCSAAGKTTGDGARTRLWGTFSPRAEIWTAFVFAIGTLVIVSVFTGVYGLAQLVLGRPPVALLVPVGAVLAALLLYLSALVGQGMSISEMYRLRAFVDDCLREAEEADARAPETARESSQL